MKIDGNKGDFHIKIDSNSGYKKKDAWRLAQAVILFLATYLMSSGPILAFF
jgi:hypothetical protein